MGVLIATAAIGLLVYLMLRSEARWAGRLAGVLGAGVRDSRSAASLKGSSKRMLAIEQRLCRCDRCQQVFVLSYERSLAVDAPGNTTVSEVWVECGRTSCRQRQPVLVPMGSWKHKTGEWLGLDQPAFARWSRRAIQNALNRKEHASGRPTKG